MAKTKPDYEGMLAEQCVQAGLPAPELEYKFAKLATGRLWRSDLAWPWMRLLVEVEGGVWSGGRHVRGKGFEGDMEKYNTAALLGYAVLRFTPRMVKSGEALQTVTAYLTSHVFYVEETKPVTQADVDLIMRQMGRSPADKQDG